jgi:hypothetical protein
LPTGLASRKTPRKSCVPMVACKKCGKNLFFWNHFAN